MSYRKSPLRSRRYMSGSRVRATLSDGRAIKVPPEKKRSSPHVRPLRSTYGSVAPAAIRKLPAGDNGLVIGSEPEFDLACVLIGLTAIERHNAIPPASRAPQAIAPMNQGETLF